MDSTSRKIPIRELLLRWVNIQNTGEMCGYAKNLGADLSNGVVLLTLLRKETVFFVVTDVTSVKLPTTPSS